MPVVYDRLHGRDDANSTSAGSGQRVSIDGGIDSKRNIIAMILATVLFIVVVVLYQYMSIVMARREAQRPKTRTRHRRPKSQTDAAMTSRFSELLKGLVSFLKHIVSPPPKPPSNTSSSDSMEALMKITPRQPPRKRAFLNMPCMGRRKEYSKSKREAHRVLRPLLLNSEVRYAPRSPIDEKTQQLLRSPDAFAEFSDPVRNMNFVRVQTEVQRRKERDEIWFEEPLDGPEKPIVARVAPLAIRKKSSLSREGEDTDSKQVQPTSVRVIYPPRPLVVPATPPSPVRNEQSLFLHPPYSPRQLSIIQEEPESPAPRSFFETDDDDDVETEVRQKRYRLRFPLPSPTKASLHEDIDVFSIGSFSDSDGSSEGSGH